MDKRAKDFNDTLNLIATVPNLLQKTNEKLENVNDSINSNTTRIGNVNAEFAEIHNINKDLLNTLSTLQPQELLKIVKNFQDITEPLKKDIQKIILEEILKNIQKNIEDTVFKELKTFVTNDFKASTKKIIETYEQEIKEKILNTSNTLIDSIKQNAEDIKTLNENRVEIKKNVEDLKKNIAEDNTIKSKMLVEDQEERAKEIKQIKETSNRITNKVDEYNFLNSAELHFYNNISQATLGIILTVAGAIKRFNIVLVLLLLLYTVFKGFIAYKVGTTTDKHKIKAIDEKFFENLKDKIVSQVLYFASGICVIVCSIILYNVLNKKNNINLFETALTIIDFIIKYQFLAIFIINLLGFIPVLISTKIENSFKITFKEQETWVEDKKRKDEIVSRGFKFTGFLILGISSIIAIYYFVPTLFLKY
ncbi:MAG: hypothetical protein ACTTJ3_05090 [Treponema sp.]